MHRFSIPLLLLLLPLSAQPLSFEPEEWSTPKDAWVKDQDLSNKWNLWTTDVNAKAWTKGRVLRSPVVQKDRATTDEGAPALHTVLTGIPSGTWAVTVKAGRGLAFSLDGGGTWTNLEKTGGKVGTFAIKDGKFSMHIDDRFASAKTGSCYYDSITLTPVAPAGPAAATEQGVRNGDFESSDSFADSGWGWWSRDGKGKAEIVGEARSGKRALRIEYDGEKDWAVTEASAGFRKVVAGSWYRLVAWMRKGAPGQDISVQLTATSPGKPSVWDIGEEKTSKQEGAWVRVEATGKVPEGYETLYVRVRGSAPGKVLIDDLTLEKIAAPPPPPPRAEKPRVVGWAKSRSAEKAGRALVALRAEGAVYLGWRLLKDDPEGVAFNVWRTTRGKAVKLNPKPIDDTTDFVDRLPEHGALYHVTALVAGQDGSASEQVKADNDPSQPYRAIPVGHPVQKAGFGDLNGDGIMDYVVKHPAANQVDPYFTYWKKSTNTYKLEAFLGDGTRLWQKDLGWSIELGIWYSPYIVYDFNGDGKAEVAVKLGEGDPRDAQGKVGSGPEWVCILDGMTGKEITRAPWPTRDGIDEYNYFSRNQIGMAYLDGKTPCLILARGTYTLMKAEAWQLRGNTLEPLWAWNSAEEGADHKRWRGQGAHSMHCVDVDGDGRDEVLLGSCVLDDNGMGLWTTGLGHPDKFYVTDIDPARPGLEAFYVIEPPRPSNGVCLVDAATGRVLWGHPGKTHHVGYGLVSDIDPSLPGMECWGMEDGKGDPEGKNYGGKPPRYLFTSKGEFLRDATPPPFNVAWWDADLLREVIAGRNIMKYKGERLGGIEGTIVAVADVLGDWREEILTTTGDELRIYTTTIPAIDRRVTLMQDPVYRIGMAHASMGYIQEPMLGSALVPATTRSGKPVLTLELPPLRDGATAVKGRLIVRSTRPADLTGELVLEAGVEAALDPARFNVTLKGNAQAEFPFTLTLKKAPGLFQAQRELGVTASFKSGDVESYTRAATRIEEGPLRDVPLVNAGAFSAQGGGEVKLRDDKVGSFGKSISHWDAKGHWLSWNLDVPVDGRYWLVVRYCAVESPVRTVSVDGAAPFLQVFPSTGGFSGDSSDWKHLPLTGEGKKPLSFTLKAGKHTVKMTHEGVSMNVNYLAFVKAP
jgi:rhamnogalacturonan endolyase